MDNDIRQSRIATLERYLRHELEYGVGNNADDSKIYSLFLTWYAEPYMASSRIRTVALAKRMLAELKQEAGSLPSV